MTHPLLINRRRFVTGVAASAVVGLCPALALAKKAPVDAPNELRGNVFHLTVAEKIVNFTGTASIANAVNGSTPAPTLRWKEGETVTIHVTNNLSETSSIHWHGILLPANMDGVPGLSYKGIAPGETFTYRFTVKQAGTYWYHSHSGFQEQKGIYGAIVIEPAAAPLVAFDHDEVVVLSDWTDEDPMRVFGKLKKMSDYYNFNKQTALDFIREAGQQGVGPTWVDRKMWGQMRMLPTDLADVSSYSYTYLMNGHTPDDDFTSIFKGHKKLKLRFINAAAMTYFDVRIPGLKLTVVAADGQDVHPVTVDEFRIGVAETYDVIVEPERDCAYSIFAQSMDRSGYARGTLTDHPSLTAEAPSLDKRPLLTMADMGHGSMDHSQMDHAAMGHRAMAMPKRQTHPASEAENPGVDMQAMTPTAALSDPGVGLRNNGRRVLTYADLCSVFPDPDGREPSREIELHLTGHMERYIWSFNGVKFADSEPLKLKYGERVRFTLVNDTMMAHPIHLHGVWSDLEDANGDFLVRKHTINMPPGTKRSYRVSADALGRWAYHCHLLFHMESGMFREVRIDA